MQEPPKAKDTHQQGFTDAERCFIQQHIKDDVSQLILKSDQYSHVDAKKLAIQILSRQKALKKLPEWCANDNLVFPPPLSVEQSSSEATARYKASMISGHVLIDITGGMGVDCFYMSRNFSRTIYFEQQQDIASVAGYNFHALGSHQIEVRHADSISTLEAMDTKANWIYADPARRGSHMEKVVRLADCTPDILSNLTLLSELAPNVLLKTSPLLDIDLAVKELQSVKEVYIVGYEHECKELLFVLERSYSGNVTLRVRIINASGEVVQSLDFDRKMEQSAKIDLSDPLSFLYEPHAAVLKSGAFKIPGPRFGLKKLAVNSHLYTSEHLVTDFPGRTFQITGTCKPDIKEIVKFTKEPKANLTIRNFPAKIQELRKKWGLKDGGDFYLFATSLQNQKNVIIVTKKLETDEKC